MEEPMNHYVQTERKDEVLTVTLSMDAQTNGEYPGKGEGGEHTPDCRTAGLPRRARGDRNVSGETEASLDKNKQGFN
jgi:hypothetical protein